MVFLVAPLSCAGLRSAHKTNYGNNKLAAEMQLKNIRHHQHINSKFAKDLKCQPEVNPNKRTMAKAPDHSGSSHKQSWGTAPIPQRTDMVCNGEGENSLCKSCEASRSLSSAVPSPICS